MAGVLRQGLHSACIGDTQNDWLKQWRLLDTFVDWIKDSDDPTIYDTNDEYSDDDDDNNSCVID